MKQAKWQVLPDLRYQRWLSVSPAFFPFSVKMCSILYQFIFWSHKQSHRNGRGLEGVAYSWIFAAAMQCDYNTSIADRPECLVYPKTAGIFDSVAGVRLVASLLGLIGSFSIIALALLKKRVFNPEVHPIFMLSVADSALAVLWIAGGAIWLSPPESYSTQACYVVTLPTVMLECITTNLILVYAIFAFISTSKTDLNSLLTHINKGISWKLVAPAYGIAWFLPVILVLLVFGSIVGFEKILNQIDDCTCWCLPTVINVIPFAWPLEGNNTALYDFINHQHDLIFGLGALVIVNYIVVFISLVVLYIKILRRIKAIRVEHEERIFGRRHLASNASQYGTAESSRIVFGQNKARKRVVIFLTIFVVTALSNIILTIFSIVFLADRSYSEKHPYQRGKHDKQFQVFVAFLLVQSFTIGIQGFINAIAYGWTRDDFVQIISVPLNNEIEPDQDSIKDMKNELEISESYNDNRDGLMESLYPSSVESDID